MLKESEVKISAGIVLFNPELNRLEQNIRAIAPQVSDLILIDNHSDNLQDIWNLVSTFHNVHFIENLENKGIAFALNQIIKQSEQINAEWVLTLDQDSVSPHNLISEYRKYINLPQVGLLSCIIDDRNVGTRNKISDICDNISKIDQCITSATLMNLKAAREIGGFDNKLFIDSVDHDFCVRIRKAGYSIVRVNSVYLLHEVGHSKIVKFLGKENIIFNHSPFRHYYIVRNKIILGRKFNQRLFYTRKAVKHFLLVALYETSKLKKIVSMVRGFYDGMRIKI